MQRDDGFGRPLERAAEPSFKLGDRTRILQGDIINWTDIQLSRKQQS